MKLWFVFPVLIYQIISLIMTSKFGGKYNGNKSNTGCLKKSLPKWCVSEKHCLIYNQAPFGSVTVRICRNFSKLKKNFQNFRAGISKCSLSLQLCYNIGKRLLGHPVHWSCSGVKCLLSKSLHVLKIKYFQNVAINFRETARHGGSLNTGLIKQCGLYMEWSTRNCTVPHSAAVLVT
jgi:hypothetical protein